MAVRSLESAQPSLKIKEVLTFNAKKLTEGSEVGRVEAPAEGPPPPFIWCTLPATGLLQRAALQVPVGLCLCSLRALGGTTGAPLRFFSAAKVNYLRWDSGGVTDEEVRGRRLALGQTGRAG